MLTSSLPGDMAYVVVAWNAAGEGPYGDDGAGTPRLPAGDPGVCP
jgi:hypothetical protein